MEAIDTNLTFNIPLVAANDEAANFKFRNTSPEEYHRTHITGSDVKSNTVVCGRLIHVVHGFHSLSFPSHDHRRLPLDPNEHIHHIDLAEGDNTPYSLIVLEWDMHPGSAKTSHRFKSVRIDLVFAASHSRLGVPKDGNLTEWDPVPRAIFPPVGPPIPSHLTPFKASYSSGWAVGPTVGYDPFVSVSLEHNRSNKLEVQDVAFCSIAGQIRHEKRACGEPNAVRFTFLENEKARSGVPPTVRTAVLLRRRTRDTKGKFSMMVGIRSEVNWWRDGKERLVDAVPFKRPRDDPVFFDPGVSYVVQDGERVERNNANIRGVDWRRLGEVDLKWLVQNQNQETESEDEGSRASFESVYEDALESP